MFSWRVTKYNPKKRDINGIYLDEDEWISYDEIGNAIHGKLFTYEEYLEVENAYIASILLFLQCNKLEKLCIVGLEKACPLSADGSHISEIMKHVFDTVENGVYFDRSNIEVIARLILRDKLWCKLEAKGMFVHFGWDYYMYIGSAYACEDSVKKIQSLGLYVEKYESPYLD